LDCADSIAFETMPFSMGTSSGRAELFQHALDAIGREDAHQVVVQRNEELRRARVALAAGAAAELVVDAAGLSWRSVPITCKSARGANLSPTWQRFRRVAAQDDVDAAAGHVGGQASPRPGRPAWAMNSASFS
jgi:hypothetical protein